MKMESLNISIDAALPRVCCDGLADYVYIKCSLSVREIEI